MADSIGILRFFLSLGVAAILIWIVGTVIGGLEDRAIEASAGTEAVDGTSWLLLAIDFMAITFLGICFFGLIAYSVYRRGAIR